MVIESFNFVKYMNWLLFISIAFISALKASGIPLIDVRQTFIESWQQNVTQFDSMTAHTIVLGVYTIDEITLKPIPTKYKWIDIESPSQDIEIVIHQNQSFDRILWSKGVVNTFELNAAGRLSFSIPVFQNHKWLLRVPELFISVHGMASETR